MTNRSDEIRARLLLDVGGDTIHERAAKYAIALADARNDIAFLLAEVERLTKATHEECRSNIIQWSDRAVKSETERDKLAAALDAVIAVDWDHVNHAMPCAVNYGNGACECGAAALHDAIEAARKVREEVRK